MLLNYFDNIKLNKTLIFYKISGVSESSCKVISDWGGRYTDHHDNHFFFLQLNNNLTFKMI